MIILRNSNENEIILNFLLGEIRSERFGEKLLSIIKEKNIDIDIILNADLNNDLENNLRREILADFRGYGKNSGLFENFPKIKSYKFAVACKDDLEKIKYINYSYWEELSKGSFSPFVAAETIKEGIEIYGVSNKPFFKGAKELVNGKKFLPCILLTSDCEKYIILEGHSRMTVYGLEVDKFDNTEFYILECDEKELKKWNGEEI